MQVKGCASECLRTRELTLHDLRFLRLTQSYEKGSVFNQALSRRVRSDRTSPLTCPR